MIGDDDGVPGVLDEDEEHDDKVEVERLPGDGREVNNGVVEACVVEVGWATLECDGLRLGKWTTFRNFLSVDMGCVERRVVGCARGNGARSCKGLINEEVARAAVRIKDGRGAGKGTVTVAENQGREDAESWLHVGLFFNVPSRKCNFKVKRVTSSSTSIDAGVVVVQAGIRSQRGVGKRKVLFRCGKGLYPQFDGNGEGKA
jgi:hypothetical protein